MNPTPGRWCKNVKRENSETLATTRFPVIRRVSGFSQETAASNFSTLCFGDT
jgi:hypothetical protein